MDPASWSGRAAFAESGASRGEKMDFSDQEGIFGSAAVLCSTNAARNDGVVIYKGYAVAESAT